VRLLLTGVVFAALAMGPVVYYDAAPDAAGLKDTWEWVQDSGSTCGEALQALPDNGSSYTAAKLGTAPRIDVTVNVRRWHVVALKVRGCAGGDAVWWKVQGQTQAKQLGGLPSEWRTVPLWIVPADGQYVLSVWPGKDGVIVDGAAVWGDR
jgi:hypothetical protein